MLQANLDFAPKCFVVNNVREVSFWIIHRYYPVKSFLVKFKHDLDLNCVFCDAHPETVAYMFWKWCINCAKIFVSVLDSIYCDTNSSPSLANVLFVIKIVAKIFIHKSKFVNNLLFVSAWRNWKYIFNQ